MNIIPKSLLTDLYTTTKKNQLQNQSTLQKSQHQHHATGSGGGSHQHHTITICQNQHQKNSLSKSHVNPPPQPPMRTSSNPATGLPSSSTSSQLDKLDIQAHHSQHPIQCQATGSGPQVQLVSALQSNYNTGTNPSNTSTLKKRVQIQEITV